MIVGAKTTYRGAKAATNYKAPTTGLEHIIFEYGERMKPGSFKTMVESMAEHMSAALKYGGPEASKAIRKGENPVYKEPEEPTGENITRKASMLFERKFNQYMKQQDTWDENSEKIFEKLSSHCSPTMKTKLRGI